MMLKRLLRRDNKGVGAVEFALVAPVLISFIIGVAQMGRLFYANADMKNALASGARVASVWPVPDDATIIAAVNDRLARTGGVAAANVEVGERGTDGNGNDFLEIEMTYQVPLDFIFFNMGPVTLSDSRRVFTQMGTAGVEEEEPPVSGTSTTSATSAGGTTSTSASSAGGDTSTSATSAGGDTSTSATSAGGTTSTSATSASSTSASSTSASSTSASTTSSSGNNGSSGKHNHGNCKRRC